MKKDTVVDYKKLLYMVFALHNRQLFTKNLTKLLKEIKAWQEAIFPQKVEGWPIATKLE